jgi:hypothetical protein
MDKNQKRKLTLNRETVRCLSTQELGEVAGGANMLACGTHHCAPPPTASFCPTFVCKTTFCQELFVAR